MGNLANGGCILDTPASGRYVSGMVLRVLVALAVWPAILWAGDSTNAPTNIPPIVPVDPKEVTLANQLLTPELAASILGVQVTRDGHRLGTATHAGGVSHVAYTGVAPSELHISLTIRRAGSLKENDQVYGKAKTVSAAVAVPGLGATPFSPRNICSRFGMAAIGS